MSHFLCKFRNDKNCKARTLTLWLQCLGQTKQ